MAERWPRSRCCTRPNAVLPRTALSARRRRQASGRSSSTGSRRCTRRRRSRRSSPPRTAPTAALLDADGDLALPVLDYEHAGPDGVAAAATTPCARRSRRPARRACRPASISGRSCSGRRRPSPTRSRGSRAILTYPQYWGFRLTAASRPTRRRSLGCHTDLWNPQPRAISRRSSTDIGLAKTDGAGAGRATTVLGPLSPDVATATGLPPETPVLWRHPRLRTPRSCRTCVARPAPFARRVDRHLGDRHGDRGARRQGSIRRAIP